MCVCNIIIIYVINREHPKIGDWKMILIRYFVISTTFDKISSTYSYVYICTSYIICIYIYNRDKNI